MVCALVGLFSMIENIKIVSLEKHLCVECPLNLEEDELDKRIDQLEDALRNSAAGSSERGNLERSLEDHLAERRRRDALADGEETTPTETVTEDDMSDAEVAYYSPIFDSGIWDIISIFSGAPNFWSWARNFFM